MKADSIISLDHGSGGLASQHLISGLILKHLTCPQLRDLEDCAVLGEYAGRIAFSTDSYVVDPLFFPGGDIGALLEEDAGRIHVLRDPTRGGLATTLCEIAQSSQVEIVIEEDRLPIRPAVNVACEMIGLDPLYLANEGKCLIICDRDGAEDVLQLARRMPEGRDAALIGWVSERHPGRVSLTTRIGGSRLLEPLTGQPLPRIC